MHAVGDARGWWWLQVACDPWSVHEHGSLKGRLCQLFMYQRLNPDDNHVRATQCIITCVPMD